MNKKVKKVAAKKTAVKKVAPAKKPVAKVKVAKPSKDTSKNKKPAKAAKLTAAKPAPKKLPVVKAQKIKSVAKPAEKKETVKKLAPISIDLIDYASKGLVAPKPLPAAVMQAKLNTRPIIPSTTVVEVPDHEPTVAEVQAQLNAANRNAQGPFAGFAPVMI